MSRATVRTAIANYLESADVQFLSTVKPFPAKFTSEMDFYAGEDPGIESGAIVYIYFESQQEHRIALGGAHDGKKAVEYTVGLECFMRSQQPRSEDSGADNEAFLDSLISAIRADRQAGAPNTIFQWGEGVMPGSADIHVMSYYPRQLAGRSSSTQVYSSVRVSVVEILEA